MENNIDILSIVGPTEKLVSVDDERRQIDLLVAHAREHDITFDYCISRLYGVEDAVVTAKYKEGTFNEAETKKAVIKEFAEYPWRNLNGDQIVARSA